MSNRTLRAAVGVLAGVLVIAASVAYVVAPPQGLDGYRESAAASAKTLGSQVETAALWSEVLDQGKAITPAAQVGLEEAEEGAKATASGSKATNHPPAPPPCAPGSRHLRGSRPPPSASCALPPSRGAGTRCPS